MAERFCPCGSEADWYDPNPDDWAAPAYWVCRACRRPTNMCECPVFCGTCQKPLFNGEANPCCAPAGAVEAAHGA